MAKGLSGCGYIKDVKTEGYPGHHMALNATTGVLAAGKWREIGPPGRRGWASGDATLLTLKMKQGATDPGVSFND